MSAFEEVGVLPELITAVQEMGWTLPTPIQSEAVPLILGGGDVLAAAETGSGKTGAFALPVLQIVHETLRQKQEGKSGTVDMSKQQKVHCAMSAVDRDTVLAVSPDGLTCQSRSQQAWAGGRAKVGVISGKVYFEAKVTDEGLCRVGWATRAAGLELGTDRQGFGFGGTGKKSFGKSFEDYGQKFGLNDVIGCLLDTNAGTIAFTKNGADLGTAFDVPEALRGRALYPALCLKNAELALNFGAAPFAHGPPPGYVGLAAAPPASIVTAEDDHSAAAAAGGVRGPTAIILEPARDLAEQTHENVIRFSKHLVAPKLEAVLLIGGVPAGPQERALKAGVDIVTGTPARVMDYIEQGKLSVAGVKFFVLDEADRLLDTGSQDAILKLFGRLPKGGEGASRLQTLLFSATLHSPEIRELATKICQNPVFIDLKGKDAVPESVDHVLVRVDPKEDRTWLQSEPAVATDNAHALDKTGPHIDSPENWSEAVKRLKPRLLQRLADTLKMDSCLVFVRTNFDADNLEKFLNDLGGGSAFRGKAESGKENPYSCVVLAGARSMQERRRALQAFKDGDVRFLICTDVAARGIDIQGLPYVVNMTLPDRSEDYIHRVGRVGRAEALGLAISLVATVEEKVWYCSVKGLQPWRQPDAKNTRTNDKGGHTIWYDEPQLLQDIEKRLGRPVFPLAADMSLPPQVAARVGKGNYGQARNTESTAELSAHQQQVQSVLATLTQLEHDAQCSFFDLQRRFSGAAASA